IAVESGIMALLAVVGVLLVAFVAAIKTLASNLAESRFGAILLLGVVITYTIGGTFNLILGHDVIDTVFMIFLIIGAWLACGSEQGVQAPGVHLDAQATL